MDAPGTTRATRQAGLASVVPGVVSWVRTFALPLGMVAGLTVLYTVLAVRQHLEFRTAGWDLGIFEQAIRGYSQLQPPIVVLKGAGFTLLGDHFHPILVLLGPLYRLFPSAVTLLVVQAFLFALAAFPLVAFAERTLGRRTAVAVGLVYGASFGIASAVGFDFHEIAFAVPLIAFSLSAYGQGRLRAAAAWALPLVLVKEDLGLSVVAVIGVLIALHGARRLGVGLAATGILATAIEVLILLPAANTAGGYDYWTRLASGHSLFAVAVAEPGAKALTVLLTVAVGGFVAVRSPIAVVLVPTLAWRFVGADANYWGTSYHYSAVLMPIVVAATIDGLRRIRRTDARRARRAVVGAMVVAALMLPFYPLARLATPALWATSEHDAAISAALRQIPGSTTVSASDNLIPQLTARDTVTLFGLAPLDRVRPEWIVVDPDSVRHFTVTAAMEQEALEGAERSGYSTVFRRDGVVVLHDES